MAILSNDFRVEHQLAKELGLDVLGSSPFSIQATAAAAAVLLNNLILLFQMTRILRIYVFNLFTPFIPPTHYVVRQRKEYL